MDRPHIILGREELQAGRRAGGGGPRERPVHASRAAFADKLETAGAAILDEAVSRRVDDGINPHLVFRIPIADSKGAEEVREFIESETSVVVVGVEADGAIVAFKDSVEMDDFYAMVAGYRSGPKTGINPKTQEAYKYSKFDVLDLLLPDEMQMWGRADRVGPRLAESIGEAGESVDPSASYVVDVELWHPGSAAVRRSFDELRTAIAAHGGAASDVLDTYSGQDLVLARLRVHGTVVDRLLDLDAVAEIELPPLPDIDTMAILDAAQDAYPTPPPADPTGPRLCVMDTGIVSSHPLLKSNVGHEEAILTAETDPSDAHGHGTRVAGVAVFGDIRACIASGSFASPIVLNSARVLNANNEFDDEKLIITQMREAVRAFRRHPYNCRVFNLSVCARDPFTQVDGGKQPAWAEALDILAREEGVLFVVSTGNQQQWRALLDVPPPGLDEILADSRSRIADPASSALAVTVGGLALHDAVAAIRGTTGATIQLPLVKAGELSPMTRVGPGVSTGIKPDFVHSAGQPVIRGFDAQRVLGVEPGTSVISLHNEPLKRLLTWDVGTSYAAPYVARIAALAEHGLKSLLGTDDVHPNVIRAVLAASAEVPEAGTRHEEAANAYSRLKRFGYGMPDEARSLLSDDRRVMLVAQDEIPLDNVHIFGIPNPAAFSGTRGIRRVSVSLAYDPPVRRRRLDYLGVQLDFCLVRGMDGPAVFDAFRGADRDAKLSNLIADRFRIAMSPASTLQDGVSRQRSTLQKAVKVFARRDREDYGEDMWLVVRSHNRWLPSDAAPQRYAFAVVLEAASDDLYVQVRDRVTLRAALRARARARV